MSSHATDLSVYAKSSSSMDSAVYLEAGKVRDFDADWKVSTLVAVSLVAATDVIVVPAAAQ